MCGIMGYIGEKTAAKILLEGLGKLEYRGYDSAGIAVQEQEGVQVIKAAGRLSVLTEKLEKNGYPAGHSGIGHTRWATHGAPSDENAHPHRAGKVTLVHNGIFENYVSLKENLMGEGRIFSSSTDTEAAAHLIDKYYGEEKDPCRAIFRASKQLAGSYALAILFSDIPDKLYAIRKDNPLIVGIGNGENYIASDIPALFPYTKQYYLLNEGELAVLEESRITFMDQHGRDVTAGKEVSRITWNIEAAEKGGYPHFMLKEIYEQPKTLADTIQYGLADGMANLFSDTFFRVGTIRRLVIVACGSAMHAGLLGKHAMEKLARLPTDVYIASEFRYNDPILTPGDVVLLISQSGETADTLAALRLAREKGIPVCAVVNVVGSSIAREADNVIYTRAGPEMAVATTKAYTAQTAVLYMLALRMALERKTISPERAEQILGAFSKLPEHVEEVLRTAPLCKELAEQNRNAEHHFFIGRGQDYGLCCEGSLKLKEISYIHSEAYAAGELKHGTMSLITPGIPVTAILTETALAPKTISNCKEVRARGAVVLCLHRKGMAIEREFCDAGIALPQTEEILMPLLGAIPLQLYAYYSASARGCDIDKPRNLAKSVTVE